MINAGIKEVKNNLSRYLARVKDGEDVLITDRGKPVARIIKEGKQGQSVRAALSELAQAGVIVLPSKSLDKGPGVSVEAPGKSVSDMVIENRR